MGHLRLNDVRTALILVPSLAVLLAPVPGLAQEGAVHRKLLDTYCVTCHNEALRTAELVLEKADVGRVGVNPELWRKVVEKLEAGVMPPPGMPRPNQADQDSLVSYLKAGLESAPAEATASALQPGRAANLGSSNLASAHKSSHRAVLDTYCVTCHNQQLRTAELVLSAENVDQVSENPAVWEKVLKKLKAGQMPPQGMPRPDRKTLGEFTDYLQTELDQTAQANPNPGRAPAHRLNRVEYANAIRDLLAVEIDGEAILPADDSGRGFDNLADLLSVSPLLMERYMSAASKVASLATGDSGIRPAAETYTVSEYLMQEDRMSEDLPFGSRGGLSIRHRFPLDGEYVLTVELQRTVDGYIRGLVGDPHPLDVRLDGARLKLFSIGGEHKGASGPLYPRNGTFYRGDVEQIDYEFSGDKGMQVRFPAKAGTSLVQVAFMKRTSEAEGWLTPQKMHYDIMDFKGGEPAVHAITIEGPYGNTAAGDTPSRQKIFICRPSNTQDEEPCARDILSTLARRAYRRPVTDADVSLLLRLYEAGRKDGDFESGIQLALEGMLSSPQFLFRLERDPASVTPGTPYAISDLDLASRLAFFLWSSIPDDELLGLAESNRLKDPGVLDGQIRRMLADSRSRALVENFAGQWLFLRNLRQVTPDPREFPDFDDELREGFQKETELFFENLLREDRSALDLLRADYTFVNERLARHYGIPNVYGSHFRRVQLEDETRQGLLGQGSILTVTSRANRTSPVVRGKWVLENLLGTPPPPPPPDVPSLEEEGEKVEALNMRQRIEQHRANPACASCHKLMDPIGFALENFDAIGKWRTEYANNPVDASGVLFDGSEFEGVVEFRDVLLSHSEQFVYTVTEKLLTYALGRELEYSDAPAVRKILRDAAEHEYGWSSLITGIVNSSPFQMRRSRSHDDI